VARAVAPGTGRASLRIDVEGHGREDLFDGVDLSRTVGWFTSVFPLVLPLRTGRGAGEALRAVKDRLRRVPRHGVGYGLLRYLGDDRETSRRLRAQPPAEVLFNYLGRLDVARREDGVSRIATRDESAFRDPRGRRSHLIEIDAMVIGGRLRLRWTFGDACHRRATIARLGRRCLQELRGLIRGADAMPPAPSDFPLADLE